MKTFWDTSGVLSLVLKDSRCREARRVLNNPAWQHVTSPLAALEAENRLHRLGISGEVDQQECRQAAEWMAQLFASRFITLLNVKDSRLIAAEGRRMIRHFSSTRPHRTMDLLHVACARLLRAEGFFTFDSNQSALAEAAGFRVKLV